MKLSFTLNKENPVVNEWTFYQKPNRNCLYSIYRERDRIKKFFDIKDIINIKYGSSQL